MNYSLRRAFTLIELLIVIAVLGILSAAMMLSSTESVYAAKAAVIISNLTKIHDAVNVWYAENRDLIKRSSNGKAYLVKWSSNYSNYDDNLTPVQELWDSRISRNSTTQDTMYFKEEILRLMERAGDVTSGHRQTGWNKNDIVNGGYFIEDNGDKEHRSKWFVGYTIPKTSEGAKIKEKLAARAGTAGLLQTNYNNSPKYTNADYVFMLILDFEK